MSECGSSSSSVCNDLAVELFNLETCNFQERQYFMCFEIGLLKSCKISRYLDVHEKTRVRRWDAFKA